MWEKTLNWVSWKQDKIKILQLNILKSGEKQDIFNMNLANQEGTENIRMDEIKSLVLILLRYATSSSKEDKHQKG